MFHTDIIYSSKDLIGAHLEEFLWSKRDERTVFFDKYKIVKGAAGTIILFLLIV